MTTRPLYFDPKLRVYEDRLSDASVAELFSWSVDEDKIFIINELLKESLLQGKENITPKGLLAAKLFLSLNPNDHKKIGKIFSRISASKTTVKIFKDSLLHVCLLKLESTKGEERALEMKQEGLLLHQEYLKKLI
ncbi:MAG: hypothetical protein VX777_08190 [Chlamydiota bacterium]|nr:hypothetical protein [Chlamydiota bacterium]